MFPTLGLRRCCLNCLLMLLAGLGSGPAERSLAQLPTIELQALSQSVAQIGSAFELTLSGSRIEELQAIHFSSPHVMATTKSQAWSATSSAAAGSHTLKTEIAPAAQPGVCEVRGQGRFGMSNPRRLWLTRKAVSVNMADHAQAALAGELVPDTILLAQCQPQKRNYYRLRLEAEQTLHLVVYSQQLDSRARPIVVLHSADGQELARGRTRGDWPAEVDYHAPQAIEVTVIVFDAIYHGGPEYAYALEFELDQPQQPASGLELDSLLRPNLADCNPAVSRGRATHLESIVAVAEQSQAPADTHKTELPLHVSQTFSADRTPHLHDFAATGGQPLTINVCSHAAGQLTDPRLLLYRLLPAAGSPSQQQLLEYDDPAAVGDVAVRLNLRDPHLTWTAPADGLYRLELQDNESGPRPAEQRRYRLDVRPVQPHFHLLAYPCSPTNQPALSRPLGLNLLPGGTAAVRVLAVRREGFSEAIEVNIAGLPAGVEALPVTIHPTQSEATLVLSCTEGAETWCGPLQLTGAAAGSLNRPQPAHAATINWPAIPSHNTVQARPCDQLWLGVNSLDTAPLSVVLGSATVLEVKAGEKLAIPLSVTRRAGGVGACLLRPQNLISKVTAAEVTIPPEQTSGKCELTVAADAPAGEFSLWLQNETKVKWRDNPQALQRAEEQLAQLRTDLAAASAAELQNSLNQEIQSLTARVEELKKSTAEKELTVFLPSTTQRIRIITP